jgi:hypothetical protein
MKLNLKWISKLTLAAVCFAAMSACTSNQTNKPDVTATEQAEQTPSPAPSVSASPSLSPSPSNPKIVLENEAFRIYEPAPNLEVGKTFTVRGQARVFEAAFSYSFEDGHNVLAEGHAMAAAGAPEWGDFEFTVTIDQATNPVGTLIIYEASAKDGSPTNQLILPLKFKAELLKKLDQ